MSSVFEDARGVGLVGGEGGDEKLLRLETVEPVDYGEGE